MALVTCEIHQGLGSSDASVAVKDVGNVRTFLHVDRDFVVQENGQSYLPVGVVHKDKERGVALIELPHEADSGAFRLWVPLADVRA
jgi:hypothetical protein